jgi:uncharacterized DUF497 family protein
MDPLERLRRCKGFEWDQGNLGKNLEKHDVTDAEAEQVFFNQPLVAAPDEKHSRGEDRIHVLGRTDAGKGLFLVCTVRGELLRVISARPMSRKEREVYRNHGQEA